MGDRLFRLLQKLLPAEFRDAYGRDMANTFVAERRDAKGFAAARLWGSTSGDVLRTALVQHADILQRDLRFAWRSLIARPTHAATAMATLALGLGSAVAMYAVIDAVWLKPLPYRDAGQLVFVYETTRASGQSKLGYLTFVDLRAQTTSLQSMAAASQSYATLSGNGRDAERVGVMRVSASYFGIIGVAPSLGRAFTEAEDRPGAARRELIISDRLWHRRFGGDPSIVNRPVDVGGISYTVVGVMPEGFADLVATRLYEGAEMWSPLGYDPAASFACRTCRSLLVIGRLAPNRSASDAASELEGMVQAMATSHPTEYDNPGVVVVPLGQQFFGPVRPLMLVLAGGALVLLLVACGNVGNLLLLRASERSREMAIRTALGVTTARLVRQLLTESLLVAVAGGALGLPLAWIAVRLFAANGPSELPRLAAATLDVRACLVCLALVISSGLLFGLIPMAQLLRRRPTIDQGAGRRTAAAGAWQTRSWLVGVNVALAAVLLVGSGLLVRSVTGLLAIDLGFSPDRVLTARLALAGSTYNSGDNARDIAATVRFFDDALTRVRGLPGVTAAGGITTLPLGGGVDGFGLHVVGHDLANPEAAPSADRFVVTPGVFETLGIQLERGRALDARDNQNAPLVAVVNDTLARQEFPGGDAMGRQIRLGPVTAAPRTIVGIARDIRHRGIDQAPAYQVYVPQAQWAWAETIMTVIARTTGDPSGLAGPLRRVVHDVDPIQPLTDLKPYREIVAAATATRRVAAMLLVGFAMVALAVASVGLYGALGMFVSQRQQEIGLRMALGARASDIARAVFIQGLRPTAMGLAAGFIAAALAADQIRSMLFGVQALDPATFIIAAAILLLTATAACAFPAWRAIHVNLSRALAN